MRRGHTTRPQHRNPMTLVQVELTAGELRRLQICLFERIEWLQERLQESGLKVEERLALTVDAVNSEADLKVLTEKALAV